MIDQTNRPALPVRDVSGRVPLIFMVSLAAALLLLGRAETYVVDRARQVVTDLAAPLLELASRPVAAARRTAAPAPGPVHSSSGPAGASRAAAALQGSPRPCTGP